MGLGQWSRVYISANSLVCEAYNIRPGEYLLMYDLSSRELVIKEPSQGIIVVRKQFNSLYDLALLAPDKASSELMQMLKRGGKSRGGAQFHDHHIIPVHLWKNSHLVVAAHKYSLIDMNGNDNKMLLPHEFHERNHNSSSEYSKTVRYYLDDRWNALTEAGEEDNPNEIREQIISLIDALREHLKDLVAEEGYINNI